jgi:hypothetical protein
MLSVNFRPEKKKPHRTVPKTFGADPMRLCPCWGWNPASGCLDLSLYRTATGGVRVQLPRLKRPNNYRNLDPPERIMSPLIKKPLCGNRQEKNRKLRINANTGSRKHAVFSAHCSFTRLLLQRDRFKSYFANSSLDLAIVPPTVNGYKPF